MGNKTSDTAIAVCAVSEKRVVITKDTDFLKMHMIRKIPELILFITTGNLRNAELIALFDQNIEKIIVLFNNGKSIFELDNESIIIRK